MSPCRPPIEDVLYSHADDRYTRVIAGDGEALLREPIPTDVNDPKEIR